MVEREYPITQHNGLRVALGFLKSGAHSFPSWRVTITGTIHIKVSERHENKLVLSPYDEFRTRVASITGYLVIGSQDVVPFLKGVDYRSVMADWGVR